MLTICVVALIRSSLSSRARRSPSAPGARDSSARGPSARGSGAEGPSGTVRPASGNMDSHIIVDKS